MRTCLPDWFLNRKEGTPCLLDHTPAQNHPDDETAAPQIPGWDRPAWAVRGVKDGPELIWQREASIDVTYTNGGVEETFAPELVRTDRVAIDEAGAAVHVGLTVIHFADDACITPGEARKLAEALVELADLEEAAGTIGLLSGSQRPCTSRAACRP